MTGRSARRPTGPIATPGRRCAFVLLAFVAFWASPAGAADLYSADGFDIRWDNTIRYSAAVRISPANSKLLADPNSDDGDRDFAPGLVSNRLDWLSTLDISHDDFGVHASIAAWYDTVYHERTANNSPATYNPLSVPNTQFATAVRNLMGEDAEIDDAFAYGNFAVDDIPVSLRLGRQTVLWGESYFFDANSIASAQAPVDYIKILSAPDAYSQNVYLPVDQLSLTVQPRPDLAVSIYYQLGWRPSRLTGVGSYFSSTDYLGAGDERILLAPGEYLWHGTDQLPSANGQYGISLHATVDDWDIGVYALEYNSTYPVVWVSGIGTPSPSGSVGKFELVYPTGTLLYGASFSGYLGGTNLAGEVAVRTNAPLPSSFPVSSYSATEPPAFYGNAYAQGDTLHAQFSDTTTLAPTRAWNSADLGVELGANDILRVTQNYDALVSSDFAMNARMLFEPHYFEVLPDLDISAPIGFGYNLVGRSSAYYEPNPRTGDFEAGLSATYLSVWKAHLALTLFLGNTANQPLADRNFVSVSLERTF